MPRAAVTLFLTACGASGVQRCDTPVPYVPSVCGTWLCQTNSASMGNGIYFHELDANGQLYNDQGFRYTKFRDVNQVPLTLQVRAHTITATDAAGGFYQGSRLEGATLTLDDRNGDEYEVRIREVGQIPFWVHPELEPVPTYTFEYRRLKGNELEFHPMCTSRDTSTEWDETTGMVKTLALVFAGDRYNPRTKTVTSGAALDTEERRDGSRWFNVACAGSALAKMHLLRHTAAGVAGTAAGTLATTPDERQAMLKMLTDDICGTGFSFTVDGEAVFYMDAKGWHPFAPTSAGAIEAIWSKDGAVCLSEPRRLREDSRIGGLISTECQKTHQPATCQSMGYDLANWSSAPGAYGISANPP